MEFQSQAYYTEWDTEQREGPSNEPVSPAAAPEPYAVTEMHDLVTAIAAVGKQQAMVRGVLSQQILSYRRGIRGSIRSLLLGSSHKNVRAPLFQLQSIQYYLYLHGIWCLDLDINSILYTTLL